MTIKDRVLALEEQIKEKNIEQINAQKVLISSIKDLKNVIKDIIPLKNGLKINIEQVKTCFDIVTKIQNAHDKTKDILSNLLIEFTKTKNEIAELKRINEEQQKQIDILQNNLEMMAEQIAILQLKANKPTPIPQLKRVKISDRFFRIMENDQKNPIK
jgi:vacuolar-type H+-ATPase subunit I/STV1